MENKKCTQCGSEAKYKEGFSEAKQKSWKGYFCQNKDCKNVEWVRTQFSNNKSYTSKPKEDLNYQNMIMEELANINQKLDLLLNKGKSKMSDIPVVDDELNVKDIPF